MRWPLHYQILLPMVAVMLGVLAAVTWLNVKMAGDRATREIETQLREAAQTLATTDFPLTHAVLAQVRGLSGAEYAVVTSAGELLADSGGLPTEQLAPWLAALQYETPQTWQQIRLGREVQLGDERFLHSVMTLRRRGVPWENARLHILYPQSNYQDAWRDAVWPPVLVGALALGVVTLLATVIAARVSGPLKRLQIQVDRAAAGDFTPIPLPPTNDEVHDLTRAYNHMADMLAQYEDKVRRNEQLRTLGQLGGGIAHQLRNSVTGCRMALQLHRQDCPDGLSTESLDIAQHQLALMEKFIQRFLTLRGFETEESVEVDLVQVVENVLPLLRPGAQHVGVELQWKRPPAAPIVMADAEALEQLVMNLVTNAIEAASQSSGAPRNTDAARAATTTTRAVRIELLSTPDGHAALDVSDTGPGPHDAIRDRLFEPLVTDKADGVGLGLALAHQVAQRYGGAITWRRDQERTHFVVAFAEHRMEPDHVETACR